MRVPQVCWGFLLLGYAPSMVLGATVVTTTTVNCAVGQFRDMLISEHDVHCALCPSGKFNPTGGSGKYNPTTCKQCPSAYFSAFGWSSCTQNCPPGSYNSNENTASDSTSLGKCVTCAQGKYQPQGAQSSCIACPSGKYSNSGTKCMTCPRGKYALAAQFECTPCAADSYTVTNMWSGREAAACEECTWCMPGACMPKLSSDYCRECSWGTTPETSVLEVSEGQSRLIVLLLQIHQSTMLFFRFHHSLD
jgi:hypothetical protein